MGFTRSEAANFVSDRRRPLPSCRGSDACLRQRLPASGMSGHVRPERPVTFVRNQRSRWAGIRTILGLEAIAVSLKWLNRETRRQPRNYVQLSPAYRSQTAGKWPRAEAPRNPALHSCVLWIGIDSDLSVRQIVTSDAIKKSRAEAGSVESSPLPCDESRCATGRGDEVERWCEMNCACATGPGERWAYGEQLKRKLEKW